MFEGGETHDIPENSRRLTTKLAIWKRLFTILDNRDHSE
jgi:hypothetical protein